MNEKRFIILIAVLCLMAWSCSSSKTPKTTVSGPIVVTSAPPTPATPPPPPQAEPAGAAQEAPAPAVEPERPSEEAAAEQEPPSALLDEALNLYQESVSAWEKGDNESALQSLDEAYALMLKVRLQPDSPLIQEKNDLRLLIARRVQQIYASRPVIAGDNHKTIPLDENKDVMAEVASFQGREKKFFLEAYQRSGWYRGIILEELRREGLPEELSWLPMIESWFKVKALSPARALGPWQFISSTGYRFGLRRDRYVDERMDPVKSSRAAVQYLGELHSFFGDWTTALAAYNCGEARVQNIIRTQRINHLDNFWDLYRQLPGETARFVPRFIAAVLIISNPERFGFALPEPYPPLAFDTVTVKTPFKLSSLAAKLGLDPAELVFLNPELRQESTPNYDYPLRVPAGTADRAVLAVNDLPKWIPPEIETSIHYVKKGDTLGAIARRYRTSVGAIQRLNGLRNPRMLRIGQRLKIPGRGLAASSAAAPSGRKSRSGAAAGN